jgi:hypothetical protein
MSPLDAMPRGGGDSIEEECVSSVVQFVDSVRSSTTQKLTVGPMSRIERMGSGVPSEIGSGIPFENIRFDQ